MALSTFTSSPSTLQVCRALQEQRKTLNTIIGLLGFSCKGWGHQPAWDFSLSALLPCHCRRATVRRLGEHRVPHRESTSQPSLILCCPLAFVPINPWGRVSDCMHVCSVAGAPGCSLLYQLTLSCYKFTKAELISPHSICGGVLILQGSCQVGAQWSGFPLLRMAHRSLEFGSHVSLHVSSFSWCRKLWCSSVSGVFLVFELRGVSGDSLCPA